MISKWKLSIEDAERDAPRVTVADVHGGRSLIDANDGAYLRLKVLVVERDLLTPVKVIARGFDRW